MANAHSPGAPRFPPRSSVLTTRIHFTVKDQGVGFVRFCPFDAREILFLRGGPVRHIQPDPVFFSMVGNARVGPYGIEVLRQRQVLSPPVAQPGAPPVNPAEYQPVDDVLLLPDGELRIRREPYGFNDAEVAHIVASIEIQSLTNPADPANRDYWYQGIAPGAWSGQGSTPQGIPGGWSAQGPMPPGGLQGPGPSPPMGSMPMGSVSGPAGYASPASPPQAAAGAWQAQGPGGREVVLQSSTFTMPASCASCRAPKQTTLSASRRQSRAVRGTVTRTFAIPYCNACAARCVATQKQSTRFGWLAFLMTVLLACLGFAVPGLPGLVLVGLPTLAVVGFAIAAKTTWAPKPPPAPATTSGAAVRLTSFKKDRSVLYCTNAAWAGEFAQASGVTATPRTRRGTFARGALTVGLLLTPAAALGVWFTAHPEVHIDNAGASPLQIWVDDKPRLVVPANTSGISPPSIYVPFGKHTFGYSPVDAPGPVATVEGTARMMDDFLYNPGESGCYWLIADSYGSASVAGIAQGPQPIQEFYSFDNVDTWFGENPQSVEVSNGRTGDTRVALQRAKACMELVEHGCPLEVRQQFQACVRGAKTDADFDKCGAQVSCDAEPASNEGPAGPAEPSGSSVHPAPHGAAHASPVAPHASPVAPAHSGPAAPLASAHKHA